MWMRMQQGSDIAVLFLLPLLLHLAEYTPTRSQLFLSGICILFRGFFFQQPAMRRHAMICYVMSRRRLGRYTGSKYLALVLPLICELPIVMPLFFFLAIMVWLGRGRGRGRGERYAGKRKFTTWIFFSLSLSLYVHVLLFSSSLLADFALQV